MSPLSAGTRLGPYEIASLLGRGGMGEVYRATDGVLKRQVAIKIMPASVAADPGRLARFRREAELLGALNHPNIAHVYELSNEAVGAGPLLVMELVDGPTLADRIARGPVPLEESLAIARQLTAALDAAHEQGIVHRDLKPANIKIREDGTIKVLDFGLAKMIDPLHAEVVVAGTAVTSAQTMMPPDLTSAGVVLGTAPYMSPEQARGKSVDKRTDIWAFGCILYEMLSGRRAFDGDTTSDIVAAVLEREPDWTRLPATTPPTVVYTVRRCLEKQVKDRLRDVGDVQLHPSDPVTPATGSASRSLRTAIALFSIIAALLIIALAWSFRRPARSGTPMSLLPMERLTYDAGLTRTPAISRDGFLAYASDRSGRRDLDIWVQKTIGGTPIPLTDDPADDSAPDFSPDGGTVLFRSERNGGGVFQVPALGGEARLLVSDGRKPRFSPDGSRFVYWSGLQRGGANGASKTFIVPRDGGNPVPVLPEFEVARDGVWAPDGRSLLLVAKMKQDVPGVLGGVTEWWWAPLDGRAPVKSFTFDPIWAGGVYPSAWTSSGVLFSQNGDLWSLTISPTTGAADGPARRLTAGAQRYDDVAQAQNGDIIFTAFIEQRTIDRVSLDGGEPVTLYEDSRSDFGRATQTRDGTQIVFERGLTRGREIWIKEVGSGRQRMVVQLDEPTQVDAVVSPNGARIAYTSKQGGYVVDVSGGVPRKVCDTCTVFGFLSDSRRLLALVAENGRAIGRVVDSDTLVAEDALSTDRTNLTRLHPSPDDR